MNTITIDLNPETTELINSFLPKKNPEIKLAREILKDKEVVAKHQKNALFSARYSPEAGLAVTFGVDTQFVKDFVEMVINSIPAFVTIGCVCKTWGDRLKDWVDKGTKDKENPIIEKGDLVTIYYTAGNDESKKATFVIGSKDFNEDIEFYLEGLGLGKHCVQVPFIGTNVKMHIYVDSIVKAKDIKLNEIAPDTNTTSIAPEPETKINTTFIAPEPEPKPKLEYTL